MTDPRTVAARALACLDLTNLDDVCDADAITAPLPPRPHARSARSPPSASGREYVEQARRELANSGVRVATVVNFPGGGEEMDDVRAETRGALGRRRRRDRLRGALAQPRSPATPRRSPLLSARSRRYAAARP